MSRRVLLLEPNWKNKYPPANLMKLATYFRSVCKDDVRFYKGDLNHFYIGKRIYNVEKYRELVELRGKVDSSFFPLYRASEN